MSVILKKLNSFLGRQRETTLLLIWQFLEISSLNKFNDLGFYTHVHDFQNSENII